jgi:hypothetical protein
MLTTLLILSISFMPIFTIATHSTVVLLTDIELNQLLQIVFNSIGGSTLIPITLLESLGLNTLSVIIHLQSIGYTILM